MTIEEPDAGPEPIATARKREFLGHPIGLPVIAFTEAFERFSYYGMQTLLVLYRVKALLLSPHVERIAGFGWFNQVLTWIYGAPPNTQALASHIFGTYTALVYLTPIIGGFIADRWLGKTRTVTIGAILMAAGHFLMAFDVSFLLALLLLVLGVGCLKGNLASQVGALYPAGDRRATDAYQLYYLGISGGAFFAPLVCGALGEEVGWHWGFGAAGVGMLIGLGIYLFGRRHLPPEPRAIRAAATTKPPAMTKRDWQVLALLLLLVPVLAFSALGNQQMFNAYLVWADRSYEFMLFGHRMPTSFLVSFDALTGFLTLGGSVLFWRWFARRWREPDEMSKLIIGCLISSSGFILVAIVASQHAATGVKPALWIALLVNTLNNIGFANVFPVSLALYARLAPRALAGTVIGIYYLFLFLANILVGIVGGWLEIMPAGQFWGIHVAAILGAAAVFLGIKLAFGRSLLLPPRAATGEEAIPPPAAAPPRPDRR
jgi:POT family proton-dependent oligopeptide transporter